ncbi:unnamed protein product, partial [Polarella glacialis]
WILPGSRPRLRRPVARAVHSSEGHPPEDTQPSAMQRVLVVGGGCTGACAAMLLRKKLGPDASIEIWEKARGFGGRMTTTRQDVAGETVRADVGAQYLSADLSDPTSKELIDMLLTRKVVAEVGGEKGPGAKGLCSTPERQSGGSWHHFAGLEGGVNSALKCLADQAQATAYFEKRVASMDPVAGGKWRVRPFTGAPETFDAVLFAVPGCGVGGDNIDKIHGGWENLIDEECNRQLRSPQHDHRHAVVLFLAPEHLQACEAFFGPSNIEAQIDDDMVHLLAYQSRKTACIGGPVSKSPVVVVHTTHEFSRRNQRAGGRDRPFLEAVAGRVVHEYLKIPKGVRLDNIVLGSKVITWKQCQITRSMKGPAAFPLCKPLSDDPPLVLAGDYFTNSSFTGCAMSAANAVSALSSMLKGEKIANAVATASSAKRPADSDDGGYGKGQGKGKDSKGGKGKGKKGGKAEQGYRERY